MEQKPQDHLFEHGWCVIPEVLSRVEAEAVRARLWQAADESQRRGRDTYIPGLDPNDRNVCVFNLLDLDPVFLDLIQYPVAVDVVRTLLDPDFIISNFTANIALPGSQSMRLHSDQSIVVPEPWYHPWAINMIWCLDEVDEENGATRFIPGSHKIRWRSELPGDAAEKTMPFQAQVGSIVAMDGRLWHTSGANVSTSRERALLFGYYSSSFIRGQQNWDASLSAATVEILSPQMREWLGFGERANVKLSTRLREPVQSGPQTWNRSRWSWRPGSGARSRARLHRGLKCRLILREARIASASHQVDAGGNRQCRPNAPEPSQGG